MSPTVIYLDHAATTPVDPAVAACMAECLTAEGDFANPASVTHDPGRRAATRIDTARGQVAAFIGAEPREIVFTSGATEANNLAVLGRARAAGEPGHLVVSRIEHKAVLDPVRRLERAGWAVSWVGPDAHGRIDPAAIRAALRPETRLVSVMLVNNETGVIQDLERIAELCRAHSVPVHTDAAQAAGRVPLDVRRLGVDFLSLTAHKLYGPKGIGALYVRESARPLLQPISFGGGQERGLRPGTLATHQIAGFGLACEIAGGLREAEELRLAALRTRLRASLAVLPGVHFNGEGAPRVGGILSVSFEDVDGESLRAGIPELAVSAGSACNSASAEPSYVLRALGRSSQLAQASLRISLGRGTREADVDRAGEVLRRVVTRLRAQSPAAAPAAGWHERGTRLIGEAGGPQEDIWVRFALEVQSGSVKAARVQVRGCPHTVAVCEWLREALPGRSLHDPVPGSPPQWAQALGVPVEKLGRLLVVEDALRACLRSGTQGA